MQDARTYEKKVRKLLSRGAKAPPPPSDERDRLDVLVEAVFQANASRKQAADALRALREEFVDVNELRVSPPKEIVECVGRGYPNARRKADMITGVLGAVYNRTCGIRIDYMESMTKRDLRRHLDELGLSSFPASYVTLMAFGGHAVPVDEDLVECLEMDGYIHPGSDLSDVQGFLERIIARRDAVRAYYLLREYVEKSARKLARRRQARAEAEAKARAEAEAKAKAEAKARAKKKAAKSGKARKRTRKKTTRKTARKAERKTRRKRTSSRSKTTAPSPKRPAKGSGSKR